MIEAPRRPRLISLTILGFVLLSALQLWKVVALWQQSALLLELHVRPDPRLRMVVALLWSLIFLGAAIAIWRRNEATRWLAPLLLVGYVAYELAFLALFAQVSINEQRWLLPGLVAGALLVWTIMALNNSAARSYFSEEKTAVT
jgi:hypothetical protein